MTIKFTLKTGTIKSTKIITNKKGVEKIVPAKVKQNDVLLEDGTNTYLIDRNHGKVVCETDGFVKNIVIYQNGAVLKKYRWIGNKFIPTKQHPEWLANHLNEKYF